MMIKGLKIDVVGGTEIRRARSEICQDDCTVFYLGINHPKDKNDVGIVISNK